MNELLDKVVNIIENNTSGIAAQIGELPLFGAVGGSISLNLANSKSDIDMYAVMQNSYRINTEVSVCQVRLQDIELDIMCVPIDELQRECINYDSVEHIYPTRFHRKAGETEKIKGLKDIERPDFKREMVMRIFQSVPIIEFGQGTVQGGYGLLKQGLKLIDIWDMHFSRAYGNFHENIKDREKVLLRKYLYTISEITICNQLMLENKRPIMDFEQMFTPTYCIYKDIYLINVCKKLWEQNRQCDADKSKKYVLLDNKLNNWIEMQLKELIIRMEKKENWLRNTYLTL